MHNKTEIIDKLCKYNEYILLFQTTDITKKLVQEIIKLRNQKDYNDLENIINILDQVIEELNKTIQNNNCSEYLECIKENVIKSKNYVLRYI